MKKSVVVIVLSVLFVATASAQDRIVKNDASEIEAKVITVSPDKVTYKKWSNPDGPTYEMMRSDIFFIRYQNGEKEILNDFSRETKPESKSDRKKISFQAYSYLGADFNSAMGGPTLDVSAGVRITDYFYAGLETGFHTMMADLYVSTSYALYPYSVFMVGGYIPIGLNMKGYLPVTEKFMPYLNCTLGGAMGCIDFSGRAFYCNVGTGFDLGRFSFGIGYMNLGGSMHNGYVKLGYKFGK